MIETSSAFNVPNNTVIRELNLIADGRASSVTLAKSVKAQLMKGKIEVPDAVVSKWTALFDNFNAKSKTAKKRN